MWRGGAGAERRETKGKYRYIFQQYDAQYTDELRHWDAIHRLHSWQILIQGKLFLSSQFFSLFLSSLVKHCEIIFITFKKRFPLLISIFNSVRLQIIFQVKSNKVRMLSETDEMGIGPLLPLGVHSSDSDIKKHILTIKKISERVGGVFH